MAQAADHRAHLAHDRIRDDVRRIVDQAPATFGNPRRALDIGVPRDRSDGQRLRVDADIAQVVQGVDVDQDRGTREPKPHRRNEALTASQDAGLGPMLLQESERLVCRVSPDILEGCRNHVAHLMPRLRRP